MIHPHDALRHLADARQPALDVGAALKLRALEQRVAAADVRDVDHGRLALGERPQRGVEHEQRADRAFVVEHALHLFGQLRVRRGRERV